MKISDSEIEAYLWKLEDVIKVTSPVWPGVTKEANICITLCREVLAARKMRDAMGGANDSGDGWFVPNEYVNSYDKAREGQE